MAVQIIQELPFSPSKLLCEKNFEFLLILPPPGRPLAFLLCPFGCFWGPFWCLLARFGFLWASLGLSLAVLRISSPAEAKFHRDLAKIFPRFCGERAGTFWAPGTVSAPSQRFLASGGEISPRSCQDLTEILQRTFRELSKNPPKIRRLNLKIAFRMATSSKRTSSADKRFGTLTQWTN